MKHLETSHFLPRFCSQLSRSANFGLYLYNWIGWKFLLKRHYPSLKLCFKCNNPYHKVNKSKNFERPFQILFAMLGEYAQNSLWVLIWHIDTCFISEINILRSEHIHNMIYQGCEWSECRLKVWNEQVAFHTWEVHS